MHEVARLQAANLGNHHGQKRIGRNIERNTQEGISAALVKLATELAVGHIELEEAVAGRQRHLINL